jgi:uncharacterized protein
MQLTINHNAIRSICKQEDIIYLGLFGSQARNEAKKDSDVDMLVQFKETKSFFELSRIKDEFEAVFGKKVDLVLKSAVKETIRDYIEKDLITLYGQR